MIWQVELIHASEASRRHAKHDERVVTDSNNIICKEAFLSNNPSTAGRPPFQRLALLACISSTNQNKFWGVTYPSRKAWGLGSLRRELAPKATEGECASRDHVESCPFRGLLPSCYACLRLASLACISSTNQNKFWGVTYPGRKAALRSKLGAMCEKKETES